MNEVPRLLVTQGYGLTYRGYAIEELAQHSQFEEVAYLLIHGHLPVKIKLASLDSQEGFTRAGHL